MYLKPLDSDTTQMAFFSWKMCNFDIIWIILFFCSKIFVFLVRHSKQNFTGDHVQCLCFLLGIGYAMSILGPAVGYVLGGQLLTLYIDVDLKHR